MAMTPEGKIKHALKKMFAEFENEASNNAYHVGAFLYSHWPVQNGMGQPTLDCIVCYCGRFIGIETKAPGKKPTPRQLLTISQMQAAGAVTVVIDSLLGIEQLRSMLNLLKWSHTDATSNS